MPVNDNDSRVKRTKKLIRKGLAELAKEKSINKITVKELTDLIEINRGTFYLHYKDIYDLVESIENSLYDEFNEIIATVSPKTILETPIDILERFCVFISENADAFVMLIGENGDANFVYRIGTVMNDAVFELFSSIYPEMDSERYSFTYEYCKYGSVGLIRCWIIENHDWTPRQVAELWLRLIARGVWGIMDKKS
ncbi:MAG: TetR/AcrR family transcriptional regulator [Candidatus Fimenecus sp.]